MRPIVLEYSEYDIFNGETWSEVRPALLITPKIVSTHVESGIWLYCFDEEIAEDATSAIAARYTPIISIDIGGASVEGIDLETIAHLSVAQLAEILAAQI